MVVVQHVGGALLAAGGLAALVVEPVADLGDQLLAVVLAVVLTGGARRLGRDGGGGVVLGPQAGRGLADGGARRGDGLAAHALAGADSKGLGSLAGVGVIDKVFLDGLGNLDSCLLLKGQRSAKNV